MIGIVNYGIGNLTSIVNALDSIEAVHELVDDPRRIASYPKLILPGVGAFRACVDALDASGMRTSVVEHARSGKPLLGICVGMQMLADVGTEFGRHPGLGLVPGTVVRIPAEDKEIRLPHVGWNSLHLLRDCPLLRDLSPKPSAYFVHSYHFVAADPDDVVATVEHGTEVTAAIARGSIFGVQFHPEKSQRDGLAILKNFSQL